MNGRCISIKHHHFHHQYQQITGVLPSNMGVSLNMDLLGSMRSPMGYPWPPQGLCCSRGLAVGVAFARAVEVAGTASQDATGDLLKVLGLWNFMNHPGFHRGFLGEISWLIIMVYYGWLIIIVFKIGDSIGLLLDHIGRFDEEIGLGIRWGWRRWCLSEKVSRTYFCCRSNQCQVKSMNWSMVCLLPTLDRYS